MHSVREALNMALMVGDLITIPHIRKAVNTLDQCRQRQQKGKSIKLKHSHYNKPWRQNLA